MPRVWIFGLPRTINFLSRWLLFAECVVFVNLLLLCDPQVIRHIYSIWLAIFGLHHFLWAFHEIRTRFKKFAIQLSLLNFFLNRCIE